MPSYKELKLKQLKKKYETQYGVSQQDADLQASRDVSKQEEENDKGNVWQQIVGGIGDLSNNFAKGFFGLFEGVIDAGAGLVGLFGDDEFKKGVQDFQNIDIADNIVKGANLINPGTQINNLITTGRWYDPFDVDNDGETNDVTEKSFVNNMSETGQSFTRGLAQALGQVTGQILTVGTAGSLGASANVAKGIGYGALGASSFGSGMSQANQEGASFGESFGYGLLNAGKEVGTELLVGRAVSGITGVPSAVGGALAKGEQVGSSIFSRFQNKAIKSFANEGAKKFLKQIVSEFTEEGLEEAVGSLIEPVIQKVTYKKDKSISEIFEENGGWGGVLEDFLVGGISGGIAGGVQTGAQVKAVGKQLGSTTIKGNFEAYGVQDAIAQICDVDEQLAIELLKIKGGLNENVDLDLLKDVNNVRDFVEKYATEQGKFTKEGDINNEAKKIADLIKQRENIQNKFTNAFEEYAKRQGLELDNMADANGNVEVNETTLGKLRAIDAKNQFNERATATKETLVKEGIQKVFGDKVNVEFGNTNNFDASNNKITLNKNSNDSVAKLLASLGHESEHKFGTKKFRTQMLKAMGITETQLNDMANKYALRKGRDSSGKFTNYEKLFKKYAESNGIKEGTQEYSDARKEYFKDEIVADLLGVYVSNNIDELQRSIKRSDAGLLKRGIMNIQDLFKGHEAKQFRKAMNYFAEGIKEDTKAQNKAKKEAQKNTQTNVNVKPAMAYSLDEISEKLNKEEIAKKERKKAYDDLMGGDTTKIYRYKEWTINSNNNYKEYIYNDLTKNKDKTLKFWYNDYKLKTGDYDLSYENFLNKSFKLYRATNVSEKEDINNPFFSYAQNKINAERFLSRAIALDNGREGKIEEITITPKETLGMIPSDENEIVIPNAKYTNKIKNIENKVDKLVDLAKKSNVKLPYNKNELVDLFNKKGRNIDNFEKQILNYITKNSNVMYSLDEDSDGNELSTQQQEFFKESKVRDKQGRLLTVYHGTKDNFNTFDINKAGQSNDIASIGFWFTTSEQGAKNFSQSTWYGEDEDYAKALKGYIDIKKPKVFKSSNSKVTENYINKIYEKRDPLYKEIENITNNLGFIDQRALAVISNNVIFKIMTKDFSKERLENVLNAHKEIKALQKKIDKYNDRITELRYTDSYEKFRTEIYKTVGANAEDANLGGLGKAIYKNGEFINMREVVKEYKEKLIKQGYDGIIIEGTRFDTGTLGSNNNQYIIFEPNQFKLETTKKPTKANDMRYSLDNENNPLSPEQEDFFKDSVIRDENGKLKVFYHGTPNAGFTVFNKEMSNNAFFFTDGIVNAGTYGRLIKDDIYSVYLNIKNPYVFDAKNSQWDELDVNKTKKGGYVSYKKLKTLLNEGKIKPSFDLLLELERHIEPFDYYDMISYIQDMAESTGRTLDEIATDVFNGEGEFEGQIPLIEYLDKGMNDIEDEEYNSQFAVDENSKIYIGSNIDFADEIIDEPDYAKTRDIVDEVLKMNENGSNYDGIIFKNIIDYGANTLTALVKPQDVVVAFEPNQIKNIDNTNPTNNEDIRYSLDDNSSFEDYELTDKDLETYIPKNIQRDVSKIQNKTSDFEDFEGSPSLKSKKALAIVSDCRNIFDEMYDDITSIKEELEELADKGKYNTKEFSELFNVFRAKLKYLSDIVSVAEEYVENVDTSGDYVNDITDNQQELLDQRMEEAEDLFSEIEDSDYDEYLELVDEYLEQIEKENNNGNKQNDIQRILEGNRNNGEISSNSVGTLSSSEWRSANAEEISELSQRLLREEYNTDPSNRRLDIIVDNDGNEYLVNAYNFTYNNLQELFKTIDPERKQMLSDSHTLEEFKNAKLCLTSADGKSTVCVLDNGDIINLINVNEEVRGFTKKALALAIDNGGIKMDNYNIPLKNFNLTYLYSKSGFILVSSTPYNAEFVNEKIRENFTKKNNGEPIMFMRYTGENKPVFDSYEECQEYTKQNVVSFDDWDEASNYRDENIKDAKDKLNSFKKNESAKPKYGKDNTTYQRVVEDNTSTSQDYDLENSFGWKGKGKNSYAQKVRSLDRVLNISKEELKKISISELSNRLVEAQQIIDNIYSQYKAIKEELSNSKSTKEERKALLEKLRKIAQNGILDIYTNLDNAETGLLRNVEQLLNEYTNRYKTEKNKDGLLNPKNMDIEQIESDIFDIKEYYEENEISQKAQEQIEEKVKKLKEQKAKEKNVVKKTTKPNTAKYEKKIDTLNKKYDEEITKEKELLKKIRTLMTERTILNEKANNAWKKANSLKMQLVNAVESSRATTEQLKKQAREMNKNLKKENTSLRAKNRTLVNQNASLQSDLTGVKKIPSTFRATLNTLFDNNLVYDDKTYKEIVKDLSKGNIDGVIDKLLQTKYRNKNGKTVVEKDLKDILSQSDKELLGEVLQEYLEGKKDSARTRWLNAYKEIKKIAEISITLARTHKGLRVRIERKGTSTASPILASVKSLGDLIKTPTRANITNGSFREGLGTFYKQFKAHKAEIGIEMPPILESMLEDILSNQDKPTLQEIEKYPEVLRGIRNFIDTISGEKEVTLSNSDGTTFKIKVKDIAVEGVKNQKRQAKIQGAKGSILHKVLWTVDPRVTMQYMDGKGSKDGIMHQFYNRFVVAQYIDKPKLYNELVRPLEDFNRDNADFIKSLKKEKITIKIADQEISITKGEALSLYNLIKDDGAYRHIIDKAGGLEINGKKIQNITQEDMLNFETQMVETFKLNDKSTVANKYLQLQRQLLDKAGKVKYQTDINNYGISNIDVKVDEDYNPVLDENGEIQFNSLYFPIQTSDLSLSTDLTPGKIQQTTVAHTKQMSFNYNRTSYSGAIVVNDIDEVLQSHLNQMTTYGALSNVIEDFNQVLNRKIDTEMANGETDLIGSSILNTLNERFGKSKNGGFYANDFFKNWIADIQGITRDSATLQDKGLKSFFGKIRGNFARFALYANFKVAVSQTVSYFNASKYIQWKNLALATKTTMKSVAPIPDYYNYRNRSNAITSAYTLYDTAQDKLNILGKPITMADSFTIRNIWKAVCIQEGIDNNTDVNSEAYKRAEMLFIKTVSETQPMYDKFSRSRMLNTNSEIMKALLMFQTQNNKNWSNFVEMVINKDSLSGRQIGRTVVGLASSMIFYAMLTELFKHLIRDNDDDDKFFDEDLAIQTLNGVFAMLPIIGTQVQFNSKFRPELNELSIGAIAQINDVFETMNDITNGNFSGLSAKEYVDAIGKLTGIPTNNIYHIIDDCYREVAKHSNDSVVNSYVDFKSGYNGYKNTNKSLVTTELAKNNNQLAKGYYRKWSNNIMQLNDKAIDNLYGLYKDGVDVSFKQIPSYYNNEFGEQVLIDQNKFKKTYSMASEKVNQLNSSYAFTSLNKEQKVYALKKVFTTYYDLAKKEQTGEKLKLIEALAKTNYNLSNAITHLAKINDIKETTNNTRKEMVVKYINRLSTTAQNKYIIFMLAGYKCPESKKKMVQTYLRRYLPISLIKEILE